MTHYRTLFDDKYLGAWDLDGDVVVTIKDVESTKLTNPQGKENQKILIYMKGTKKGLICGKLTGGTIAELYGSDVEKWVGKKITLFVENGVWFGKPGQAIRIRPEEPKG